uniref:Uncharacterized protein n=1 Tax=Desulfatirhabdium butyrativorans TaxID=340467 RepID=A0A7C4RT00_9BACT
MVKFRYAVTIGLLLMLAACGPRSVAPKYLLDTPSRHVSIGMKFIDKEKWEAARLEFDRAVELDASYAPGWVGLAIIEAQEGNFEKADALLSKAQSLYQTEDHRQFIQEGFHRVDLLKARKSANPKH